MAGPSSESERLTRKKRIDPKLKAAGWKVVPLDGHVDVSSYPRHAIEEYPTANGLADYALVVDGKLLGAVEAKKLSLGPQGVLQQAERYAKGLSGSTFDFRGFHVPFLFSTNGEIIYFHDVRHELGLSPKIATFFPPSALACETLADLARREGRDYEPALMLLERIEAERTAAQIVKTAKQLKKRR